MKVFKVKLFPFWINLIHWVNECRELKWWDVNVCFLGYGLSYFLPFLPVLYLYWYGPRYILSQHVDWISFQKIQSLEILVSWSVQFSLVPQSCPNLCDPMDCSTPSLPVHHQLLEFTQTCVHWVGDAIQPSHPLSSTSPPALNLSQHQGLFRWVSSLHQVAKVLEFQLQHQSFQWTPRTDLL